MASFRTPIQFVDITLSRWRVTREDMITKGLDTYSKETLNNVLNNLDFFSRRMWSKTRFRTFCF